MLGQARAEGSSTGCCPKFARVGSLCRGELGQNQPGFAKFGLHPEHVRWQCGYCTPIRATKPIWQVPGRSAGSTRVIQNPLPRLLMSPAGLGRSRLRQRTRSCPNESFVSACLGSPQVLRHFIAGAESQAACGRRSMHIVQFGPPSLAQNISRLAWIKWSWGDFDPSKFSPNLSQTRRIRAQWAKPAPTWSIGADRWRKAA